MPITEAINNNTLNLIDIFTSITSQSTMDKLLKKILEASFTITGIPSGSILLIDSSKFICCTSSGLHECTNDMKIYESNQNFDCEDFPLEIIDHVIDEKKELYIKEPYNNCIFSEDPYIKLHLPKTVLCFPIIRQNKVLAILYLEDIFSIISIPKDRFEVLSKVLSTASLVIENIFIKSSLSNKNENISMAESVPTAINDITSKKLIQLQLHERDARYEFLFQLSPEAICVHDNGIIIMANSAAAKLMGVENVSSLIGRHILDFVCEDFKKIVCHRIDSIISGSNFLPCVEEKFLRADGSIIDVEVSVAPFPCNGKTCAQVIVHDVTEQKKTQLALKHNEAIMRELTENTLDILLKTDYYGVFRYITPSSKNTLGYNADDLLGKNFYDFLHPLDLPYVTAQLKDLMNTEYIKEKKIKDMSFRLKHSEGYYLWFEVSCKRIPEHRDKSSGLIMTLRDITKRIEAQNALKVSEERYKLLVNMLPDAVYVLRNDKICFSNKAGLTLLGAKSTNEVIEKNLSDFALPLDTDKLVLQNVKKQLTTKGRITPIEEKFLRKRDNLIIDIETIATNFSYEESTQLVVCRNISERKKTELLQVQMEETNHMLTQTVEYDKLRTEFFANISHELRTPINIVLSSLQLFELLINNNPIEIEKLSSYIKTMKQNCYRLIRLVNNLIDVTKIDSGYLNANLKNCNIISIIEDITLSVVPYLQNKNISLTFDTDVEEKFMACDPDKIERIMLNLISNAFKFTNLNGTIHVTLKDLNDHIIISVKDNGIGIPKDKQELIFQRFVQVDRSLAREHEGSGIGLSIVKSLVEMHEGTISLKSEYGHGSEFIIKLPAKVLDGDSNNYTKNNLTDRGNIDKINIELSDIYV